MVHLLREYLRTAQDDEPTEAVEVKSASSECSSSALCDLPCPSVAIINNSGASSSRPVLHEVPVQFCFSGHCGQTSWPFAEEDFEEDREVVVWEGWPEGLAISRAEEDIIVVVDLGPDLEADYLVLSTNVEEREPKYIVGLK